MNSLRAALWPVAAALATASYWSSSESMLARSSRDRECGDRERPPAEDPPRPGGDETLLLRSASCSRYF